MTIDRRQFLSMAAATGGTLIPLGPASSTEAERFPLHKRVTESHSICPYCSVGCGVIVATDADGHIVNTEGDPDHPVNRGRLDSKALAITQLAGSPLRLRTVRYRAPGSDTWQDKPWDWAMEQIAARVKATRDATFVEKNGKGVPVNRTEAIAWLGGAANNNEDCYLAAKLTRALGMVYVEHQARV